MQESLTFILKRLGALINVKTIITFVVTGVFATLSLTGQLDPDKSLTIITMVITFYFGVQHEKKSTSTEVK